MTSLRLIGAVIVAAGLLTGCAQEDDSIVNPVPGRRRITNSGVW
jgi:outer membrane murein-binding lipoprotein Lpp